VHPPQYRSVLGFLGSGRTGTRRASPPPKKNTARFSGFLGSGLLRRYTSSLDDGNQQGQFYYEMNSELRFVAQSSDPERRNVTSRAWELQMYHMMAALGKLSSERKVLYRGRNDDYAGIKALYTEHRQIKFGAWTSCSTELGTAVRMSGPEPGGIVLKIEAKNAKCIQRVSLYSAENEYLLPPEEAFVVIRHLEEKVEVEGVERTVQIIHLFQLCNDKNVVNT